MFLHSHFDISLLLGFILGPSLLWRRGEGCLLFDLDGFLIIRDKQHTAPREAIPPASHWFFVSPNFAFYGWIHLLIPQVMVVLFSSYSQQGPQRNSKNFQRLFQNPIILHTFIQAFHKWFPCLVDWDFTPFCAPIIEREISPTSWHWWLFDRIGGTATGTTTAVFESDWGREGRRCLWFHFPLWQVRQLMLFLSVNLPQLPPHISTTGFAHERTPFFRREVLDTLLQRLEKTSLLLFKLSWVRDTHTLLPLQKAF